MELLMKEENLHVLDLTYPFFVSVLIASRETFSARVRNEKGLKSLVYWNWITIKWIEWLCYKFWVDIDISPLLLIVQVLSLDLSENFY